MRAWNLASIFMWGGGRFLTRRAMSALRSASGSTSGSGCSTTGSGTCSGTGSGTGLGSLLADAAKALGRADLLAIVLDDVAWAGFAEPASRVGYRAGAALI